MQDKNRLNVKVLEIFRGGTLGDGKLLLVLHIELVPTTVSSLRRLSDYHPCFTHKVAISEKFGHFLQGHTRHRTGST